MICMFSNVRRYLKSLFSITGATALEGMQQPVTFLLVFTCLELTVLQPMLQLHTLGEGGRLTRDSGLAFMLVFGIFIALFTSGFTLSKEISGGTAAAAVSKPVTRSTFITGKFLGALTVIACFAFCQTFAILFAERCSEHYIETKQFAGYIKDTGCGIAAIAVPAAALVLAAFMNWWKRWRFGLWFFLLLMAAQAMLFFVLGFFARDGKLLSPANYEFAMNFRIISAAILILMLLMVFVSLATAFSTRLHTGAALAVSFAVFFAGFIADSVFGGGNYIARSIYALLPDVQHFWVVDSLAAGGSIPIIYVARATLYAVTYSLFVLLLGAISFETRDLS